MLLKGFLDKCPFWDLRSSHEAISFAFTGMIQVMKSDSHHLRVVSMDTRLRTSRTFSIFS